MKIVFCGILYLEIVYCIVQLRLSTNSTEMAKTMNNGDSIISTLGNFKATLQKTGCRLGVYGFNNGTNSYQYVGNYNSSLYVGGDCNQLMIDGGRLLTDSGQEYLTAYNIAYNYSTIFTIDDQGVMRLISTYMMQNMVDIISNETSITVFKTNNNYLRSFSQYSVSFGNTFAPIQNQRNWKFIVQYGQLTIYYSDNPGIKLDYVFSAFNIKNSRIYDFNDQTFPGSLFTNISFSPRCCDPKIYLDFKPPYVFVANPYWPSVTVYQQGGYKVFDIWLSKLSQFTTNQNQTQINYYNFYSPCPKKTFQYLGDCVGYCPPPYYHQIKGESGFCVLNCEEFASVDEQKRICSCVTAYELNKLAMINFGIGCPQYSMQTPFGCVCNKTGFFYDGFLSFLCVQICPSSTFAINGICMKCPANCLTCTRDNFNREFLQCKTCKTGYTILNGQCIIACPTNQGYSMVMGSCLPCDDVNCADCSKNLSVCLKCNIMYSLNRNGVCNIKCSGNQLSVYSPGFSTTCIPKPDPNCQYYLTSFYKNTPFIKCDLCPKGYFAHLDQCVTVCPQGYSALNNYCVCSMPNTFTVNDQCLNIIACPIMMSFDIRSHSCLSCPFGCMSCVNTQCTSCNPGYFLYISPQSILCRRKGPLFPCNDQYSWQRQTTCAVTNYTDPNLAMTLCYSNIPNCKICIPQNTQICVLCQQNFYIFNNTCISTCLNGLIPYDNTCILPEISNCLIPHLLSIHNQAVVNYNATQTSQAYQYYIYDSLEMANDPIGYIPYFQQLTTQTSDGIPRQTDFFQPEWICLKCNTSYGLSDDFKQCLPCPPACQSHQCYMARQDSCIIAQINTTCPTNYFTDTITKVCLLSCNQPNKYPYIENGVLYCGYKIQTYARVDSSIFQMKNGNKMVFFVFSDKFYNNSAPSLIAQAFNSDQNQVNKLSTSDVSAVEDNALVSNPIEVSIIDGQYVQLDDSEFSQAFTAFKLNFSQSLTGLVGTNLPMTFPNPYYGSVYQADHTVFMTTWLAYIGYVMAVAVILLHAIFIGNQLLYKVDNLLIFIQSIFFFQFVQNLVGRLLAQFYYGWSVAHGRFLPNLFDSMIPDYYIEKKAPVSYKLFNIDGNYFRNAGFSLAWLLIYIGFWLIITFVVWGIVYKLLRKNDTWHPRVARQALIAGFQFFSMNLVFFSVSQLAFSQGAGLNNFQWYYHRSQALAVLTLCVITIYTIARCIFNPLGGLYMLKRVFIPIILVFSYDAPLLLIAMICIQILFAISRYFLERPYTIMQYLSIIGEGILICGCYCLLYRCINAGVNTLIISIFVFIFIVYLAYDLTTLYLQSVNQFPEQQLAKQYEQTTTLQRAQTLNSLSQRKLTMTGSKTVTITNIENNY